MKRLIICDWNRTLFNPVTKNLYKDVMFFLNALKNSRLMLVSANEINSSKYIKMVSKYFNKVVVGSKNQATFIRLGGSRLAKSIWVIGDRLDSEIYFGNICGFQTIRIKRGKFKNQLPMNKQEQPKFVAENLKMALKIILSK